jgi:hypothetical protein
MVLDSFRAIFRMLELARTEKEKKDPYIQRAMPRPRPTTGRR